jgi:hypothetical protein
MHAAGHCYARQDFHLAGGGSTFSSRRAGLRAGVSKLADQSDKFKCC